MDYGNEASTQGNWTRARVVAVATLLAVATMATITLAVVLLAGARDASAGELRNGVAYCGNRAGGVRIQTAGNGEVYLRPGGRRSYYNGGRVKVRYFFGTSSKVQWSATTSKFFYEGTYSVCRPNP